MKLVVLLSVFLLVCGGCFIFYNDPAYAVSGRLALAAMFLFSGVLHVKYRDGIYLTYPDFLSQINKIKLVFAVGDLQFAIAAGLVFADVARVIVPLILIYLILGLVTQVNAGVKNISVKRGNYTGKGIAYLFFKIPEQLIIIGWTYYFVLVCC
ncbi:hypothetical protein [Pedobacter arcticus]|uniref:hypothetical protein n=1 Tax=Pedobacter arcticus TaxID=752140 RepID=UPI00037C2BAF|nr:hypothetical protein [Pedobacter arcticus]